MLEPIGKNILVLPVKKEEKKGGLIIPNEKGPKHWKVISCGKDVKNAKNDDILILQPYGGTVLEDQGIEYTLVNEDSILVKVKGEK